MIHAILPLTASYRHEDIETRLMLRSLEKNFQEDFKLVIAGRHVPLFIAPDTYEFLVTPDGRSKTAMKLAAERYDEFVWLMDDVIWMQPTTLADLKVKRWMENMRKCSGYDAWGAFKKLYAHDKHAGAHFAKLLQSDDPLGGAGSKWWRRAWTTHDRFTELHPEVEDFFNFACHLPYFYESAKLLEIADLYEGFWRSEVVVENAYLNTHHNWPVRYYRPEWAGAYNAEQGDALDYTGARWVNFNDEGLTDTLKKKLLLEFPKRSRFEKPVG